MAYEQTTKAQTWNDVKSYVIRESYDYREGFENRTHKLKDFIVLSHDELRMIAETNGYNDTKYIKFLAEWINHDEWNDIQSRIKMERWAGIKRCEEVCDLEFNEGCSLYVMLKEDVNGKFESLVTDEDKNEFNDIVDRL